VNKFITDNTFIENLKSKSDLELERIAGDSTSYVFAARYAASRLLKNRNINSKIIEQLEKEERALERAKKEKEHYLKEQDQRLIRRIRHIAIKGTGKYRLENGNELQVKRLNEDHFQVRIEDHFRSRLAPIMICKIKDESTYFCYPFLHIKSIIIFGLSLTVFFLFLSWVGEINYSKWIFLLPFILLIGIQLVFMPLLFPIILGTFKERLSRK
jgi:hypothetical protein